MPDFGSWATAWWKPILFVIVAGHLTNVSVTLFLHRAQTHRGVKLHYLAALPMRIWLWLSTQASRVCRPRGRSTQPIGGRTSEYHSEGCLLL
jgi:fatty-acid desaturase